MFSFGECRLLSSRTDLGRQHRSHRVSVQSRARATTWPVLRTHGQHKLHEIAVEARDPNVNAVASRDDLLRIEYHRRSTGCQLLPVGTLYLMTKPGQAPLAVRSRH